MKRSTFLSLLALSPLACAAEPPRKTKVLLLTGGHGFERLPFLAMFLANKDIDFIEAKHGKDSADGWEREDLLSYDVIVLYDMMKTITDAQKAKFQAALEKGIGLVVLHHALVAYQDWDDYERIIGGRYPEEGGKGGQITEQVGFQHDVDIPVQILKKDHPATAGFEDFTIHDEIYWGFRVSKDVTPLLGTTQAKSGKVLAWARTEKKSKVVYLQLGHGPSAHGDANYRKFLAQCIQWVKPAREKPAADK